MLAFKVIALGSWRQQWSATRPCEPDFTCQLSFRNGFAFRAFHRRAHDDSFGGHRLDRAQRVEAIRETEGDEFQTGRCVMRRGLGRTDSTLARFWYAPSGGTFQDLTGRYLGRGMIRWLGGRLPGM